jgi:probable rRNA maturation factor
MPHKSPPSIQFHFLQKSADLKERQKLKAFILSIFKKEKTPVNTISYIFCSDDYLRRINQQFLRHNYFTDIISFNLAASKAPIDGEIYISPGRVRENAIRFNQYCYVELHRVIFHGALHLCGYKDKTPANTRLMRQKEDYYLKSYFK